MTGPIKEDGLKDFAELIRQTEEGSEIVVLSLDKNSPVHIKEIKHNDSKRFLIIVFRGEAVYNSQSS